MVTRVRTAWACLESSCFVVSEVCSELSSLVHFLASAFHAQWLFHAAMATSPFHAQDVALQNFVHFRGLVSAESGVESELVHIGHASLFHVEEPLIVPLLLTRHCWSFSPTAAFEVACTLITGNLVSLSQQQSVDCVAKDSSCDGGHVDNAFAFATKNETRTQRCGPMCIVHTLEKRCNFWCVSPLRAPVRQSSRSRALRRLSP